MEKISDAALQILSGATVTSNSVKLNCGQLERTLYEEVNEVLERLGGKWQGQKRVHLFMYPFESSLQIVIETGIMPPKNPLAYFATSDAVINEMITYLSTDFQYIKRILEPSAGTGAIAQFVRNNGFTGELDMVEPDPIRASVLRKLNLGTVYEMTLEEFVMQTNHTYDLVLMNPPFTINNKPTDIIHIQLAYNMLVEGGQLVSVASNSFTFRFTKDMESFREMVYDFGRWDDLPKAAFKESGTMTNTVLVYLRKPEAWELTRKHQEYNGYRNFDTFVVNLYLNNDFKMYQEQEELYKELQVQLNTAYVERKIVKLYEKVYQQARKQFENIKLDQEDFDWLVDHFMSQYQEWIEYKSTQ